MNYSNAPLNTGPDGVPIVEDSIGSSAFQEGQLGAGIRPTYWEKFWSQAALGLRDAPVGLSLLLDDSRGAIPRWLEQKRAEGDAETAGSLKLTPDQANRKFPGLQKPFTEPVYPEVAKLISDENQRRQRMSAWIARGPETGRLFDLGAGAMSGADPFNLVVGALIPVGRAASIGGQIARRFGADLAANLVGEVPGLIQRKREQQELPTAGEVVVGAATGALLSTGIHTAFEVALRRGQDIVAQKPTPVVRETTEAAIRMHESGAKIDVTPAATLQAVRDAGGVMTGVENPHEFRQLGHPSEAHYYIGLDPETGKPLSLDDLGGGIVGVDNKAVANNGAGLPESAFNGKVVRADLSADANLVDSEMSLKDFFGGAGRDKAIEKIAGILGIDQRRLSQYHDRFRKLWTEKGTVRDLFNLFQDAATDRVRAYNDIPANDFRKLLDGMGYDGMNFTGHAGDTPIDNRIVVFNEEKLSPVEVSDAAKNEVPQFTVEQQKAASERAQAPEQERWFDQNAKDLVKEKALVHDAKVDVTTVDQNIALAEQNARIELAERAIQNPELADEIALADREFETAQYEVEAVKNMAKCMEGAVV